MNRQEQDAIESLFAKLARVEDQSPPRDPEVEALIRRRLARQPGAAYYMAQTIIVQEQALAAAKAKPAHASQPLRPVTGHGRRRPRSVSPAVCCWATPCWACSAARKRMRRHPSPRPVTAAFSTVWANGEPARGSGGVYRRFYFWALERSTSSP